MTEVTELPRIVKCPKCRQLLPEYSHYTVYRCGGCGATLGAKKRKKVAANPESCTHEADANSRNAVNLVSEDEERSRIEQPTLPHVNVLRTKSTRSSSAEYSLYVNDSDDQTVSEEGNWERLVLPNGSRATSFSSASQELN